MTEFIQIEERDDSMWSIVHLRWNPSEQDYETIDVLGVFQEETTARFVAESSYPWLDVRDA